MTILDFLTTISGAEHIALGLEDGLTYNADTKTAYAKNVSLEGAFSITQSLPYTIADADVSGLVTTSVTDFSYMFYNCQSLTTITGLSSLDLSGATSISHMFDGCSTLSKIEIGFDTSAITDMSYMLNNCTGLLEADLSSFTAASTVTADSMFAGLVNTVVYYNKNKWELSTDATAYGGIGLVFTNLYYTTDEFKLAVLAYTEVKKTGSIYKGLQQTGTTTACAKGIILSDSENNTMTGGDGLTLLEVGGCDFSNVTDISYMFYHFYALESISFDGADLSNVKKANYIFQGDTALKTIDFGTNTFGSLVNAVGMFSNTFSASNAVALDLSKLDFSKLNNFNYGFQNSAVKSVVLPKDMSNCLNMEHLFESASVITSIDFSNTLTDSYPTMTMAFYNCTSLVSLDITPIKEINDIGFTGCTSLVELDLSNKIIHAGSGGAYDGRLLGLRDLPALKHVNLKNSILECTSEYAKLTACFTSDTSLIEENGVKAVDFTGFTVRRDVDGVKSTTYVNDISYMFSGCTSLNNFDLKDLKLFVDFASFTGSEMERTFAGSGIESLSLSNLTTDNILAISNIDEVFIGCNKLKTVDLHNVNFTNTTNEFWYLFRNNTSLESVNMTNMQTPQTNFGETFNGCKNLVTVLMDGMCKTNGIVNAGGKTSGTYDYNGMFRNCTNLETITFPESMNKLEVADSMFYGCNKLKSVTMNEFTGENLTSAKSMFGSCTSIEKLEIPSFDTSKLASYDRIFSSITGLKIYISDKWTLGYSKTFGGGTDLHWYKGGSTARVAVGSIEVATIKDDIPEDGALDYKSFSQKGTIDNLIKDDVSDATASTWSSSKITDALTDYCTNGYDETTGIYWRKWQSGIMEQWGIKSTPNQGETSYKITLAYPYIDTNYVVLVSHQNDGWNNGTFSEISNSNTVDYFYITFTSNGSYYTNAKCHWHTIGRWKA